MVDRLVVLGGTGDLSTRHLLPAVALLAERGVVSENIDVVSLARDDITTAQFRHRVDQVVAQAVPAVSDQRRAWLLERLRYARLDLTDPGAASARLAEALQGGPSLCYVALPPSLLPAAVRAISSSAPDSEAVVVVEKPFGEDLASARSLNRALHALLAPRQIFRADHFLHHQVVQDVLAIRLGGSAVERLWGREHVESVEIVWEEGGAVAGRAELFDRLGSIRDMVQSHLLQLLTLVAMDRPQRWEEVPVRESRLAVLRAVRTPLADQVAARVVRGRYTAGVLPGGEVAGYAEEPGVDADRGTETYVCLQLEIDLDRWRGVPFVLRTGKAIGSPRRFVELRLRGGRQAGVRAPSIRIELDPPNRPARVDLGLSRAAAEGLPGLVAAPPSSPDAPADLPATARLLREALSGRQTLFPSAEEVEECWRVTDAVLAACRDARAPLHEYRAGSTGPPARLD